MKTRYGLEVRAATNADAQGLCNLLGVSGREVGLLTLAERLEAVRQQPGAVLLAADWGPPIGLVSLHWYRTLHADQPIARIDTLVVEPEARRRGIGRMLLKAAAQAARTAGCDTLELLGARQEASLRSFCLATGFTETGRCFSRPLRKKSARI